MCSAPRHQTSSTRHRRYTDSQNDSTVVLRCSRYAALTRIGDAPRASDLVQALLCRSRAIISRASCSARNARESTPSRRPRVRKITKHQKATKAHQTITSRVEPFAVARTAAASVPPAKSNKTQPYERSRSLARRTTAADGAYDGDAIRAGQDPALPGQRFHTVKV